MSTEDKNSTQTDPFEAFREMRDSYLDSMSKVMIKAVNSEEYAQATGAMLNNTLKVTAPFREALDKAMAAALQQSSMPSRQELATLAGRFTNVEMRLDDMEAKLDRIIELCSVARPEPASEKPDAASKAQAELKRNTGRGDESPLRGSRGKG